MRTKAPAELSAGVSQPSSKLSPVSEWYVEISLQNCYASNGRVSPDATAEIVQARICKIFFLRLLIKKYVLRQLKVIGSTQPGYSSNRHTRISPQMVI